MNLFYLLAGNSDDLCSAIKPFMTLLGYVIMGIKIIVPIILIVIGMIELAKAIVEQDEGKIKKAQNALIKKIIVAVCVYLVISVVNLVISLINPGWDKSCNEAIKCALSDPFDDYCDIDVNYD